MTRTTKQVEERFWSCVEPEPNTGCWLWAGTANRRGYGRFTGRDRRMQAHRFAYELLIGPIPQGLELDHLCRVTCCVNPDHLEPVTHKVNVLRGLSPTADCAQRVSCPRGHPYDEQNTHWRRGGRRACKRCKHLMTAAWRRRVRERRRAAA